MSEEKKSAITLSDPITHMIEELVRFRNNTWEWLETVHTIKDTTARQKELRAMSADLSALSVAVLKQSSGVPVMDKDLNANLRMIEIARGYADEIRECLKDDYDAKKKESGDNKVDVVKNVAFLIGTPTAFVAGVKNGVGNGHIDVNEAFVLGIAIAIPTVFHKKVGKLFSKAAKALCAIPEGVRAIPTAVGNNMRVVNVREVVKEKTNSAKVCFAATAKSINNNIRTGRRQTASLIKRVIGGRGPRPGA